MNTNIHEWRILKIKIEIRVHSCSFVAKMERLNTHTEIAISSNRRCCDEEAPSLGTQKIWVMTSLTVAPTATFRTRNHNSV